MSLQDMWQDNLPLDVMARRVATNVPSLSHCEACGANVFLHHVIAKCVAIATTEAISSDRHHGSPGTTVPPAPRLFPPLDVIARRVAQATAEAISCGWFHGSPALLSAPTLLFSNEPGFFSPRTQFLCLGRCKFARHGYVYFNVQVTYTFIRFDALSAYT